MEEQVVVQQTPQIEHEPLPSMEVTAAELEARHAAKFPVAEPMMEVTAAELEANYAASQTAAIPPMAEPLMEVTAAQMEASHAAA